MAATLVIDIITNASKAQADLARAGGGAKSLGSRVKASMKGVGTAIAGAFAVQKVVAFAKDSIGAASDLNETMSKTQQVFGDSGQAIIDWSKDSSNALGQSQTDALDAASSFAIFGKSAGLTGGDLTGFSTKLTGLASDMASFSNTTPQDAAEALGAALRGESEPIRRYGVLLDDASLRQEAMRLGLVKTTKEALTPQQKVLASYKLIMAQTKDAQGDFARTSDGLANQQRILAAKMTNVKATLGTALLPIVLQAVTIFQQLAHWGAQNQAWLVPIAAVILAVAAAVKIWTIAQAILNSTLLANPVFLITVAVIAFVAAIIAAYKKCKTFRDIVNAVFGAVKKTITGTFDAITAAVKFAIEFIRKHWLLILGILTGPIGLAVTTIIKYRNQILDLFRDLPGMIAHALSSLANIITKPFIAAWHFIRDHMIKPLKSGFNSAIEFIKDVWNAFARVWNSIEIGIPKIKIPFAPDIPGFTVGLPDLPILGAGGYVNRATLAVVGDRGGEIVAPEPMLRAIIRSELAANSGTVINVHGALDPDAVARQVERLLRGRTQRVAGITQRGQVGALR